MGKYASSQTAAAMILIIVCSDGREPCSAPWKDDRRGAYLKGVIDKYVGLRNVSCDAAHCVERGISLVSLNLADGLALNFGSRMRNKVLDLTSVKANI